MIKTFDVAITQFDNVAAEIIIEGTLDVYTVPDLRKRMADLPRYLSYCVNLDKTIYLDSVGLQWLIDDLYRGKPWNSDERAAVYIICGNPQIRRIFDITGLKKVFKVFETEKEMFESFNRCSWFK